MAREKFYRTLFILILLWGNILFASSKPDDLKIISSDTKHLTIEYNPSGIKTSSVNVNGKNTNLFSIPWTAVTLNGKDGIRLKRNLMAGVPAEFGNTIEILESKYYETGGILSGVNSSDAGSSIEITDSENGSKTTAGSDELVSFGEFGFARDIPVQRLTITAAMADKQGSKVKIYTKIVFRINFTGPVSLNNAKRKNAGNELLRDAIINYEAARSFARQESVKALSKGKINSVLSAGKWYRFEAPEEGIYKITQQTISSLGLNPQTIDPKTIRIYNNGGKAVSEVVGTPRGEDLLENSVFVQKAADDGKFNADDYVLFYGRGINFWEYDTAQKAVVRYYHPYSKSNYYFMTFSQGQSKRMQDKGVSQQTSQVVQQTTKAYASWEEDKAKLMNSGRQYMGDSFGDAQKTRSYLTNVDGILQGAKVTYKFSFVSRSEDNAGLRIDENSSGSSTMITDTYVMGLGYGNLEAAEGYRGIEKTVLSTVTPNITDGNSLLKFTYSPISQPNWGYLNYFEISYTKQMKASADQLMFYSPDTTATVEYRMTGFTNSNFSVYDVTDAQNVKIVGGARISGGDCTFTEQEQSKQISKYMAVNSSNWKSPQKFEQLTNSNLHGNTEEGKLIVITHRNFLDQARRLEQHKESLKEKVETVVVDVQDVFNEFSGGMQDVSGIRDYIKYAYDNWTIKPEYVLLFGDGDYDYK
ncbi:MAG: C25 family cysteine peptidase, partial [Syntrophothermus sp.]